MFEQPSIMLNDGRKMPQIGQGVWQVPADDTAALVSTAIAAGYRAVDTAAIYRNEKGVGDAVRASDETIFVTTKVWNTKHGRDAARAAFDRSFEELGLDWIDLYLIHWPVPAQDKFVETWRALVELRGEGRVRSIGVSNFSADQIRRIADATGVLPAVNQVELHPGFAQDELVAFHREQGIATTSWSPLGRGAVLDDPVIVAIARKHGRTPAQIVVQWHLHRGLIVIPKASSAERLAENLAATDVVLDEDDMAQIATLDRADGRVGPDPATM